MVLNFDIRLFCENLRATKPPYQCPVKNCGKIYRSHSGIQFHLYNYDHDNPDSNPGESKKTPGRRGGWRQTPAARPELNRSLSSSEPIVTHKSQHVVEVNLGTGRTIRVDIHEPLKVVVVDDAETDGEQPKKCSPIASTSKEAAVSKKEGTSHPSPRLPEACFKELENFVRPPHIPARTSSYYRFIPKTAKEMDEDMDYDMDEMDEFWLNTINDRRKKINVPAVTTDVFEKLMDRFEKESYFQCPSRPGVTLADDDAICCVCFDGESNINNAILFCDLCNIAVHQECYGVPHIPNGPWVCRRCLHSPSRGVDCCLCPSQQGALKQTDDDRWAHVVCAQWIPEVGFANTVFLEPIDSLDRIAHARWKLTCYICKRRGVGACIQCHKPSCYTAFHVTCGLHAGLFMKAEPLNPALGPPYGLSANMRKTAYCAVHSPKLEDSSSTSGSADGEVEEKNSSDDEEISRVQMRRKVRRAKKVLAENNDLPAVVSIPVITATSLMKISRQVSFPRKKTFINKLLSYWYLKRKSIDGVPLRRAATVSTSSTRADIVSVAAAAAATAPTARPSVSRSSAAPKAASASASSTVAAGETENTAADLVRIRKLRQQLEKVRLLLELIKKRERLKLEQVKLNQAMTELRLRPLATLLRRALDQIEPPKEMGHLSEMRHKLFSYQSVEEFVAEFQLILASLLEASLQHNTVHRTIVRMKDQAIGVVRNLRRAAERIGFDDLTGLHSSTTSSTEQEQQSSESLEQQNGCAESTDSAVASSSNSIESDCKESNTTPDIKPSPQLPANVPSGVNRRTMILFNKKAKLRQPPNAAVAVASPVTVTPLAPASDVDKKPPEILVSVPSGDALSPAGEKRTVGQTNAVTLQLPADVGNNVSPRSPAKRKRSVSRDQMESTVRENASESVSSTSKANKLTRLSVEEMPVLTDTRPEDRAAKIKMETEPLAQPGKILADDLPNGSASSDSVSRYPARGKHSHANNNVKSPAVGSRHPATFNPLDCVWAKCRGFPWYPGMIISPKMPRAGFNYNGLHIPAPPNVVLDSRAASRDSALLLVMFFDSKRTWQWLPHGSLENLGIDPGSDAKKLMTPGVKPVMQKSIEEAFERATVHQRTISKYKKAGVKNK